MKLKIKDIYWTFVVLSDKEYELLHGKDSGGITLPLKQIVHFRKSLVNPLIIAHELFHVYVASCCFSSTDDIGKDAMEEVGAEIIEFHLDDIVKFRDKIYERLS